MLHNNLKNCQGSVLIIAIFIVIVFGTLSIALNRLRVDNSSTFLVETLHEQAELATFSALEIASIQLYPLNQHAENISYSFADTVGSCTKVSKTIKFDDNLFPILKNCVVKITCERRGAKVDTATENFGTYTSQINYFLKAQATCEFGEPNSDDYYKVSHTEYSSLIDGD